MDRTVDIYPEEVHIWALGQSICGQKVHIWTVNPYMNPYISRGVAGGRGGSRGDAGGRGGSRGDAGGRGGSNKYKNIRVYIEICPDWGREYSGICSKAMFCQWDMPQALFSPKQRHFNMLLG